MRILNIMLAERRGGVETMSLRYHAALKASGVSVLSMGHPHGVLGEALMRGELPGDEFRPVHALFNHDPFAAARIRAAAREFQPDLVLTHGNRATGICLLPFLGTAARTVQVIHNFRLKGQIERVRAAICVSASVTQSVRDRHPGLPVYELANFGPLGVRPVKPAPQGVVTLGVLGRHHVNKGFDVMLRAFALLRQRGLDLSLRIGGDGPERGALERLARELGVTDRVEFVGWVDAPADFMHGLDLFVLPSRVEPFGLVVAESMAAGAPIIATGIDGPEEILLGGQLGGLCAPDNPQALADAIAAALSDWPATSRRAEAAQDYALGHFSLEAGRERLISTLDAILTESR
ncbi:MAG: glycosyltransferase [Asticcacaulis sp.]|uniref:glycosyltransferase n=1 Tax=Asticcacaulis sp. TaxID=1872648 RepID=UPI003F7C8460